MFVDGCISAYTCFSKFALHEPGSNVDDLSLFGEEIHDGDIRMARGN